MAAGYHKSTRNDHLRKLSAELVSMTNFNRPRQRWLSAQLHRKYGHETTVDASEAALQERLSRSKDTVWSALRKAFGALKNTTGGQGGRIDNHRRAVRQILLTIVSSSLPANSLVATANDLGIYGRDLTQYR